MKCRSLILIFLAFSSMQVGAQSDFRFKRNINGVETEGWYSLVLRPGIFHHMNDDLGDFRIYSVTEGDTVEIPYLLRIREDRAKEKKINLALFNKSYHNGVMYLTFELAPGQKVNVLDLAFDEKNYLGHVKVEGSDDRLKWFEVLNDQRLVSIKRGSEEFRLSTVNFPMSSYRYLRLSITSDVPLHFKNASFGYNIVEPGKFHAAPLEWTGKTSNKERQTVISIKLKNYAPVSLLEVQTNNEMDFYRAFELSYVRDSIQSRNGWVRRYHGILDGNLTSFKANDFNFPLVFANELRLVIRNGDNRPLDIRRISAAGPEVNIVTYLKPGNNFMLYGDEKTRQPSYDLEHFANKIPGDPPAAELDHNEEVLAEDGAVNPIFQNKIWLWGIMGVMICGLAFFTIKMIRN